MLQNSYVKGSPVKLGRMSVRETLHTEILALQREHSRARLPTLKWREHRPDRKARLQDVPQPDHERQAMSLSAFNLDLTQHGCNENPFGRNPFNQHLSIQHPGAQQTHFSSLLTINQLTTSLLTTSQLTTSLITTS